MMTLKFGMPQLLEFQTLEDNIKLASQLELNFLELNFNLPYMQPHLLNVKQLLNIQDQYGIFLTAHAAEDLDLGHFNPHLRKANVESLKECLELAHEANIQKVNMHMNKGIIFTMPEHKIEIYETYQSQYLSYVEDSLAQLTPLLNTLNVQLVIENTGLYDRSHICKAVDILLSYPKIALTWDVGHDRIHHYADDEFMSLHHDRVKHLHLHDANERNDHLELLTGDIGFKKYFELAKVNDATCLIEVKTAKGLINSLHKLRCEPNHKKLGYIQNNRQH